MTLKSVWMTANSWNNGKQALAPQPTSKRRSSTDSKGFGKAVFHVSKVQELSILNPCWRIDPIQV